MTKYEDLIVWQKAMDAAVFIYNLTKEFPKSETYGLTSQLRRAVVSIPSNIAEGNQRRTKGENLQFLGIAYGSCAEVQTQINLAKRLGYVSSEQFALANNQFDEIGRMLNTILSKLSSF